MDISIEAQREWLVIVVLAVVVMGLDLHPKCFLCLLPGICVDKLLAGRCVQLRACFKKGPSASGAGRMPVEDHSEGGSYRKLEPCHLFAQEDERVFLNIYNLGKSNAEPCLNARRTEELDFGFCTSQGLQV